MAFPISAPGLRTVFSVTLLALLGACASRPTITMSAHECMTRVMYFESNRSSEEGMIAVGTVVMNRVADPRYPSDVCSVVGQKNQFAPGVLTRSMAKGRDLASRTATKVLARGWRHSYVGNAKFFHTAGMTFPYTNMHYLVEAGGNVFYEKRKNARRLTDPPFRNPPQYASRFEPRSTAYAAPAPQPSRPPEPASRSAPLPQAQQRAAAAVSAGRPEPMSVADLIAINGG
ncbi:cell wall hydrolase [Aurantimonas sp. VKM B-3413]|uniref:cell wall hydrolase n=1 Tax=Aurantimonas sp. VKM B-3413 TaxID=2779401 RepID=UPI00351D9AB4